MTRGAAMNSPRILLSASVCLAAVAARSSVSAPFHPAGGGSGFHGRECYHDGGGFLWGAGTYRGAVMAVATSVSGSAQLQREAAMPTAVTIEAAQNSSKHRRTKTSSAVLASGSSYPTDRK